MTPLRELYDLYYYPNPAKEERRRQLLAEISTDARDEDNYGRTSLHIAAEFADCEAIASLLDHGAEVNDRDEEGHTPLFRLASRRSRVSALEEPIASAARLLLDRGANLPRSARGTTALIEAVQNRHHAMAAVLIGSGQRLDSANSYGDNALHILCRRAADTAREIAGKERFIASFGERWVSEKQQREAREELEDSRRNRCAAMRRRHCCSTAGRSTPTRRTRPVGVRSTSPWKAEPNGWAPCFRVRIRLMNSRWRPAG